MFAQERVESSQFGLYVHGALNIHSANFQTLPGVPSCCPRYENGDGLGLGAGVFYDFLTSSPLAFQMRLGYSTLNATLKTDEFTTVLDLNGNSAQGEFEHSVQASIGLLSLTPLAKYQVSPQIAILGGPELGWVTSNNFTEKESLLEPSFGTFENGLRERNVYSGQTPDASKFYFGISAGLQYHLPLNTLGTLYAVPEIFGTYGVTPLVSGMSWRASSVAGGISLEYRLFVPLPPPIVVPPPPAPVPKQVLSQPVPSQPALAATLAVATLDSNKTEVPLNEVVIEDYIRTQYRPLLNYIFFDSGSAQLPNRYHMLTREEASNYDFKKFSDYETLPLYYEMLNVVGKRMQSYPHATLTIVGCTGDVSQSRDISHARAEAVYQYLHEIWKLDASRMKIEARNLPEKPSNPSDSDGQAENRRVELYSNIPQILEPIFTIDTAHVPKPPVIRFLPNGVAQAGVDTWDIATTEGSVKLKDFSGKGALASHLDWDLSKEHESDLATLQSIHATLVIDDKDGHEAQSKEVSVPVRHYTLLDKHRVGSTDTIISRYSLILFDFDRSDLGEANQRIANFVKARVSEQSEVQILGYTDRMGSTDYNQKLSAARAKATERYIGIHSTDVRGLGRSTLLYDNTLPEGRFYSRTVTVIVTTPTMR